LRRGEVAEKESEEKDRLAAASGEAADLILQILRDESLPPETRLAAAEIALNKGDLAHRIARLEQAMGETQEKLRWTLPS
jgi:hypothetical protein